MLHCYFLETNTRSKGHLRTNERQNSTVLSEKICSTTCRKFQECTSLKSESYKPKAAMWGKTRLTGLDRLLGSRLRHCVWKSWKRVRTRIRNLIKLGLPERLAVKWGFTRRGGWHVVQSPVLQTTITNERLVKRGFVSTASI